MQDIVQEKPAKSIPKVLVVWSALVGACIGFIAGMFFAFIVGLTARVYVMGFGAVFSLGFAIGVLSWARRVHGRLPLRKQIAFRVLLFCLALPAVALFIRAMS